ncbi:DeoR/GlpR family DNA-binding transcription regulator [Streptomyces sp. RKAG337]|uniref:DeoR/GlpR family DNA-binding transcription regulator n=1 Tax=Streptomyces sp. RKAG337 TaxID=2893404 RepID=UPI0020346C7F|nr:DeoR/GlpR family DNA-binding transcription regulator [Streptomyces sp. RKAG337]MCM2425002.1 DeoR/GlpR family DNA-binding transcription regulator [Streptomyces sp. RKAG337]
MTSGPPWPTAVRQSHRVGTLLERLAATGSFSIAGIAVELGVSRATIRRDLAALEEQGLLTRTHGGAVARGGSVELPVRYRADRDRGQKQAIARAAMRALPSGPCVVALNGGTTTHEVARLLASRSQLTVVTNALDIAMELALQPRVRLVVTGGRARNRSCELVGPWAERTLGSINIDTAFIGVDGISARNGVSTHDEVEARINAIMIERSRRVVVVADGTKIGRDLLAHVAPASAVDELITDSSAAAPELAAMRAQDITVTIADLPAH